MEWNEVINMKTINGTKIINVLLSKAVLNLSRCIDNKVFGTTDSMLYNMRQLELAEKWFIAVKKIALES